MARRATASLLAATMFGTIDSNALVPIIALYAQAVGADLVQTGIIVGLFSLVHAPAVVIGFGIAGPVVARLSYATLFYILSGGLIVGFLIAVTLQEPTQARPKTMPWRR